MKFESFFTGDKNHLLFFLITLIVLPLMPFWNYTNAAYSFVVSMMILFLMVYKKRSALRKFQLADFGFLLLAVAVLFSFCSDYFATNQIPLGGTYLTSLLMITVYFCLRYFAKPKVHFKSISKLLQLAFFLVATFVLYTAFREDFNYAMLTTKLSYRNGLGNISQISMYLSFYLIGFFYTEKKYSLLGVVTLITFLLAFILQSKLLLLVIGFLLIGKFLSKFNYKTNILCFLSLVCSASLLLYFRPPSSLTGRLDLFKISWGNYDYSDFFGSGLGKFNHFINTVFESGQAKNTIGHVDHLAFNDFTQVFVELGYFGLIGLLLIFIGLVNKRNLFYLGATGIVLVFMFPLQYLESAVLFAFIAFLLKSDQMIIPVKWQKVSLGLKSVLITISCLLFFYTTYQISVYKKWSDLDTMIGLKEDVSTSLKEYKELELNLSNSDEYYLKFGLHLLKNKKYNEALKAFNKAQKLNPSYESYIYLGDCYFEMKFYSEAMRFYKTALQLRPKHLYPVYKSIYSLNNLGREKDAQDYWRLHKKKYNKLLSPKMMIMNKEIEDLLAVIEQN